MELSRSNFSKSGGGHLLSRKTILISNYLSISQPKYMYCILSCPDSIVLSVDMEKQDNFHHL